MNKTKVNKAIENLIVEANELDKEAIAKIKDIDIAKLYINFQTAVKAFNKIDKAISADVKKRKEIMIPEAEKKVVVIDKEIKIKKMTAKELKAVEEIPVKKAPVIKTVKKTETVIEAPKKRGRKPKTK